MLRIADAVDRAGGELDREIPFVGDYVHRAADELETVGRAVRQRDVDELVGVAQDFARRQPAIFAGVVGLAGFAAVRFVMASAQRSASGSGGQRSFGSYRGEQRSEGSHGGEAAMRAALGESTGHASGDPGGVAPEAPGLGLDDPRQSDGDERAAQGGTERTGSSDDSGAGGRKDESGQADKGSS